MLLAAKCAFAKFMAGVAVFSCFCKEFDMYETFNNFFGNIFRLLHII